MERRIERTRSGEDFCEGKGKAGEQGRREGVGRLAGRQPRRAGLHRGYEMPGLAGKLGSACEAVLAGPVDGNGLDFRVDDPVLLDSAGGVELVFDRQVRLARCLGEHLDDEVGGAGDVLLGDDGGAGGGNEEQVRLDDVLVGQDDVHGRDENRSGAAVLHVGAQERVNITTDQLVPRRGRGGHEMLSGDDLVPLPVVGEEEVVLVGQPSPHARGGGHTHSIARVSGAYQYRAVFVPAAGRVGRRLRALLRAGLAVGLLWQQVMGPRPASAASFDFADQVKISGGTPGSGQVLTSDAVGLATWEPVAVVDGSVTTIKIAADAVTSAKILDGAVTTGKIHDEALAPLFRDFATGKVGIGETFPASKLEVNGDIQIGNESAACDASKEGALRYNVTLKVMEFCNATAWGEVGGAAVGTVGYFFLSSCPTGWSALVAAEGRYLVGRPTAGTLGATVGTALTNLENRPTGVHSHTATQAGHNHAYDGILGSGGVKIGAARVTDGTSSTPQSMTTETPVITVSNSAGVAGTNAPYIQLLVCQKN